MVDVAKVSMFRMPVGTFRWDGNRDAALFEYAPEFIGKGIEPAPLMMPIRQGRGKYELETISPAIFCRTYHYI